MQEHTSGQNKIPYDTTSRGIAHGPYRNAPESLKEMYVESRERRGVDPNVSNDQLASDVESEWQYDQHSAAVMDALESGRITSEHAIYMLDKVLRPWFIGRRNAGE